MMIVGDLCRPRCLRNSVKLKYGARGTSPRNQMQPKTISVEFDNPYVLVGPCIVWELEKATSTSDFPKPMLAMKVKFFHESRVQRELNSNGGQILKKNYF